MLPFLFFDLGSTLIDERPCDEQCIRETLRQPAAPSYEAFTAEMERAAAQNLEAYHTALERFHLYNVPWSGERERLYDGAADLLWNLRGRYRLGVIANQVPGTAARLGALGIRPFFEVIASSGEDGFEKPDPRLFRLALSRAGCRPQDAYMIGDRLDNDILPAASLGMKTVWIRQGMGGLGNPDTLGCRPDATVSSLSELESFFAAEASDDPPDRGQSR